jgi:hypothetical protein
VLVPRTVPARAKRYNLNSHYRSDFTIRSSYGMVWYGMVWYDGHQPPVDCAAPPADVDLAMLERREAFDACRRPKRTRSARYGSDAVAPHIQYSCTRASIRRSWCRSTRDAMQDVACRCGAVGGGVGCPAFIAPLPSGASLVGSITVHSRRRSCYGAMSERRTCHPPP